MNSDTLPPPETTLDDPGPTPVADLVANELDATGHVDDTNSGAVDDSTDRRRAPRGQSPAVLRRVARKAIQVATAEPATAAMLADLHGISDHAELAVSIVTGSRSQLAPLRELLSLDTADPIELGVELGALGRPKMRTLWRLLTAVNAANGDLHASDVKAAVQAARAVTDLTPPQRKQLEAAAALGSR